MSFDSEKISEDLIEMVSHNEDRTLPVIVQFNGGFTNNDEMLIINIGGSIKNRLSIINSYSADLTVKAIKTLSLNPGIKKIYYDGEVRILGEK